MSPADRGHGWSGWLGPNLNRIRFNVVEMRQTSGRPPILAKRRRRLGRVLIASANLYLRRLGAGVRVLPDGPWQAREIAVHRHLHGWECTVDPRGWLLLPRWPGTVLAGFVADARISAEDRLRALAAAAVALRDLHRAEIDGEPLSHGDATLRNVMFDPSTGLARWFDFDTAHAPGRPAGDRHADDLRAVLYSALDALADLPAAAVVDTLRASHDAPATWSHLRDHLARGPLHAGPYHLAQAAPPAPRCREAERRILEM